jgi:hypothetical protein
MPRMRRDRKTALSLLGLLAFSAGAAAPVRADVAIEAVFTAPGTDNTLPGQKIYISGTRVRIESTWGLSLDLFDFPRRYLSGGALGKECRWQTAVSLQQYVQSFLQDAARHVWQVKSLEQTREVGPWKCKVYQVSSRSLGSRLYPATEAYLSDKEICVVPYHELANGDEVKRASKAIIQFVAPLAATGDSAGLIEHVRAVAEAVNGFPVAVKALSRADQAELIVRSWKTEPVAKTIFLPPSGCTPQ